MKKLFLFLAILAAMSWAQLPEIMQFDIIIRDFQPNHPDFENFDDRAQHMQTSFESGTFPHTVTGFTPPFQSTCFGKNNPPFDMLPEEGYSPKYSACEDGLPCGERPQAYYGEYKALTSCAGYNPAVAASYGYAGGVFKGHKHVANAICGGQADANWEDPVYVTRGMVAQELVKPDPEDPYTWYPVKNPQWNSVGELCNSQNFDHWYQDVPGVNMRIEDLMTLRLIPGTSTYMIDSREMEHNAYFPLDSLHGDASRPNFGKQSLSLWCPPYGGLPDSWPQEWERTGGIGEAGGANSEERLLCQNYLNAGGPRNPDAAFSLVANGIPGAEARWHNYAFTVMGYTKFTYNSTDTFSFSGDDDMWIFIDGMLEVDLGGTHLPAEARIPMAEIAARYGWEERSKHDLHFFYADRQTDGSNLRITTTMAEVSTPMFGAPRIKKAEREGDDLYLFLSTELHEESVGLINGAQPGVNYFPIVVIKPGNQGTAMDTMGIVVNSFELVGKEGTDMVYKLNGHYCTKAEIAGGCQVPSVAMSFGDSLAFNFYKIDEPHTFMPPPPDQLPPIKSRNNAIVNTWNWGTITTASATKIDTEIEPLNKNPESPPLPIETLVGEPGTTHIATGSGPNGESVTYNPLGSAGQILPKDRTGEVLLTLYPEDPSNLTPEQMEELNRNGFGLPQQMIGEPTPGYVVGSQKALENGQVINQKMIGAHKGDSPQSMSVAHCETRKNERGEFDNNCLAVVLDVDGPFQANVSLYDHFGNFVSRYQAEVGEEEIRQLQESQTVSPAGSAAPLSCPDGRPAVKTGMMRAGINIYPLSQFGRRIATGVYILKVDVIQKDYTYCLGEVVGSTTNASPQSKDFVRDFNQVRVPYMRTK
ncbi:MAG: fibro-slime domain-containing protein [Fibrobacter sp.]|nr:fibro-slime domain-containing protein [Fibrobacter sp.]